MVLFHSSTVRASNTAALVEYSFHNGSSFSILSFKILFHISGEGVVDIEKRVEGKRVGNGCCKWARGAASTIYLRLQMKLIAMCAAWFFSLREHSTSIYGVDTFNSDSSSDFSTQTTWNSEAPAILPI